ncbi:BON domain-containing protein [Spongiibacter sp. UBA6593]|nr:BON domain-containing protein [Spongiibacter sp. UBA6593]
MDVDTKDGVVTLRGTVKSDAARDLAIEIAKSFDKVTDVEDKLVVRNS